VHKIVNTRVQISPPVTRNPSIGSVSKRYSVILRYATYTHLHC